MHYVDLQKISTKTRKGRLLGMLIVFIFVLIVMIIMMNIQSSPATTINGNVLQYITFI